MRVVGKDADLKAGSSRSSPAGASRWGRGPSWITNTPSLARPYARETSTLSPGISVGAIESPSTVMKSRSASRDRSSVWMKSGGRRQYFRARRLERHHRSTTVPTSPPMPRPACRIALDDLTWLQRPALRIARGSCQRLILAPFRVGFELFAESGLNEPAHDLPARNAIFRQLQVLRDCREFPRPSMPARLSASGRSAPDARSSPFFFGPSPPFDLRGVAASQPDPIRSSRILWLVAKPANRKRSQIFALHELSGRRKFLRY